MTETKLVTSETKPRVLIIDNSKDIHRLVSLCLKKEGIEIVSAESGEQGLAMAVSQQPSLILLDLELPGIHGFSVLKDLKSNESTVDVPVIVFSWNNLVDDKVRSFDLGANDYITKPFEMTELRARVRQALRMRQLIQMLAQRAQLDGLTGLWNRSFFNQRWLEECARANRYGHPLSVAMLDLDYFKTINDTYGHAAGDAALMGTARLLQQECRQHDLVCRYGGEEFVIVMPETGSADALIVCERIRACIESTTWPRHPERRITASIGVAGTSVPILITPDRWVELADANLYAAKSKGRNRVICTDLGTDRPAEAA